MEQLGIDTNDKEIEFHFNYHKKYQYECLEGKFIIEYYEKLFIGNQHFQVFREPAFSDFLFINWFHVIKYLEEINIRLFFSILTNKLFFYDFNKILSIMKVLFIKIRL